MSSDNINLLSYTQNISAGSTITTEKVISGQFISLNILPKADQDLTIVIQFSGDGTNWDYSVTKNISSGSNTLDTTPVVAKWMRLRITNNGLSSTTYLRVFVYGTPTNSSTLAQISKIGNLNPEIDVANLPTDGFGDLRVGNIYPLLNYTFNYGNSSLTSANNILTPYPDLQVYSVILSGATIDFTDRCLNLKTNNTVNSNDIVQGRCRGYRSGLTNIYRFTMKFDITTDSSKGGTALVGIGSYYTDKYCFGWKGETLDYDNFCIFYRGPNGNIIIPRTSFNHDKIDGTNILPVLDFTKLQVCQIVLTYLGAGPVDFFIMNPSDGQFVKVHSIKHPNSLTGTSSLEPSFGVHLEIAIPSGAVVSSGNLSASIGSFCSFTVGNRLQTHDRFSVAVSSSGVTSEQTIINIKGSNSYLGANSAMTFAIDGINISTDGTKNTIIRVYMNSAISGSPVWQNFNSNYSSLLYDTSGTFTPSTGVLTYVYQLTKVDSLRIDLANKLLILNSKDGWPTTGDSMTITAESASATDVFCSVSVHLD